MKDLILIGVVAAVYILLGGCDDHIGADTGESSLVVSLDPSTPVAYTVQNNSLNVILVIFQFTAQEEDVEIAEIILTRQGLGLPTDFAGIKLFVNDVQVGPTKNFNTSTNTATFNISSTPLVVQRDGSVSISVRADLDAEDNSQHYICIESPNSIVAYDMNSGSQLLVRGNFPVCGNEILTKNKP